MTTEPNTENGRRALLLLQSRVRARDVSSIERKFVSYSDIVDNEDKFVDQLYVQGVLLTTAEKLVCLYKNLLTSNPHKILLTEDGIILEGDPQYCKSSIRKRY